MSKDLKPRQYLNKDHAKLQLYMNYKCKLSLAFLNQYTRLREASSLKRDKFCIQEKYSTKVTENCRKS